MDRSVALIRDLQQEVLTALLHAEDEDRAAAGTLVLLAGEDGERTWCVLAEPGPDDHRVAFLQREVDELVVAHAPVALAAGTVVKGVPDPHETLVVWAAERGGETMAMRMHTVMTWDGLLVPGPLGELDRLEAALPGHWAATLRQAA